MASAGLTLTTDPCMTADDSLVAWLALKLSGVAFTHRVETSDTQLMDKRLQAPLPRLQAGSQLITTSAAIVSFLAEHEPALWPADWRTRSEAKSAAAEVFSGFRNLRTYLPMAVVERFGPSGLVLKRCEIEIQRLEELWGQCRARYGGKGPFLFGEIGVVDAFQAPMAARCVTYGLPLSDIAENYVEAVMDWPQMVAWLELASGPVAADEVDYPGRELVFDVTPKADGSDKSAFANLIKTRSQPAANAATPAPVSPPRPQITAPNPPSPVKEAPVRSEVVTASPEAPSKPAVTEPPAREGKPDVAASARSPEEPPKPAKPVPTLESSDPVPGDIIDTPEQRTARDLLRSTFGLGPARVSRRPFQPPPEPWQNARKVTNTGSTKTTVMPAKPAPANVSGASESAEAASQSAEKPPEAPKSDGEPSVPTEQDDDQAGTIKRPRIPSIKPIGGEIRRRR